MSITQLERSANRGNEYLDHLIREEEINFQKYLLPQTEKERIYPASSFETRLVDRFYLDNVDPGCLLPWGKTHKEVKLREGELSIWSGINGHGKSVLLGQIILCLMAQSQRTCIASMEMKPVTTLYRMARQFSGKDTPMIETIRYFLDWSRRRLWLYDQIGTVKTDRMIAVAHHCVKELQIQHFVIDSLMKCGIAPDDYNRQKYFVDELSTLAKDTGAHIHLVHHQRKGKNEHDVGGKFDAKGAGEITDMADNVFIVWRNKKKEDQIRNGGYGDGPDALLIVDKQRNGEHEPHIALWFDKQSFQFLPVLDANPHGPDQWEECKWQ